MKPSFKPRARITGYSPQLHLQAKIRFKTFWIDSDKKVFSTKFFDFVIFHHFGHFGWKNKVPRKNFTREKIFDFEIFVLKYVSNHSESIPTKKNFFRPKFLDFVIFSLFWPLWQKTTESKQKNYTGKFFEFQVVRFKIRLERSESIPTKENLYQNF